MIKSTAEFFLLSMGLGVGLFTPIARSELTGAGLLKLMHAVCGVSLLLAAGLHYSSEGLTLKLGLYGIAVLCCVLIHRLHKDQKSFLMWGVYAVQQTVLVGALFLHAGKNPVTFAYFFSSVGYLGLITYAMLLGHWYLVVPKLSERPLVVAVNGIWALLFLKLLHTCWEAWSSSAYSQGVETYNPDYSFNWLMLAMRVGWGYLIIGVMNYYTARLVRMRSIQSATGILYVMTFFVFVGELIAHYVFLKLGVRL